MKYIIVTLVALSTIGCANSTYYYQNGKKQKLEPIKQNARSIQTHDYYKTPNGTEVGVNDTILVKFYNTSNLFEYAKELNFNIIEEIAPKLFKIQVANRSLTTQVANTLYEKKDVEFAHPNFLRKVQNR